MAAVAISAYERAYTTAGVEANIRSDGRSCIQHRPFSVETNVVSTTNGSARVKIAKTEILVAVKGELSTPAPDRPKEGRVIVHVECAASASPEFEGRGGEDLSVSLSQILQQVLNAPTSLNLEALCIEPGEHCWDLHIDTLVLVSRGNLLDAISIATKCALDTTLLPKIEVVKDDTGVELVISDDPHDCIKLDSSRVPLLVTLCLIGEKHVVDATIEEEACADGRVIVGVTKTGDVSSVVKSGGSGISPSRLFEMMQTSKDVAKQLFTTIPQATRKRGNEKSSFLRDDYI